MFSFFLERIRFNDNRIRPKGAVLSLISATLTNGILRNCVTIEQLAPLRSLPFSANE
ncbi:Uncharacterized protein APZ42_020829 [Daphnia magna]|uniref:Uncharacterized protein n=1 Tax=Daphnia magna TaxID=35525 RepID=A0A164XF84_9CRUS|nr:Uncharacterized protein APZ42_020829 [Daphnia magna]